MMLSIGVLMKRPLEFEACIKSLRGIKVSHEIMVADASKEGLDPIEGVKIIREDPPIGTPRALNNMASLSKGKYFFPFSDDCEMRPGSLDRGIALMEERWLDMGLGFFDERGSGCSVIQDCAQFPIILKSFGDQIGWWDTRYRHYDIDADIFIKACLVSDRIDTLRGCCFLHHYSMDEVRESNQKALNDDYTIYLDKWKDQREEIEARKQALRLKMGSPDCEILHD